MSKKDHENRVDRAVEYANGSSILLLDSQGNRNNGQSTCGTQMCEWGVPLQIGTTSHAPATRIGSLRMIVAHRVH